MIEPSDYCAILCREPDRLRIINCHEEVVEVVKTVLADLHVDNQFYVKSKASCAFKLSGAPFYSGGWSGGKKETIKIRRAFASIVEKLQNYSWHLVVSTDIAKQHANSCLFFRKINAEKSESSQQLGGGKIFTFAPSAQSDILLIDIPAEVEKDVTEAIKATHGIDDHEVLEDVSGSVITTKVELGGWWNWHSTGEQAISLRKMLMEVIRVARTHKYEVVTNLNVKGTTDSLLFQHKPQLDEVPGAMFMISLNREDRLRLLEAPDYVITALEEVITETWERGIQHSKQREEGGGEYARLNKGYHEFKLAGRPWWADGEEAVKSRYLVASILAKLRSLGWEVADTIDVSRRLNDKTVFVMRQCPPEQQDWAVLSFHESDKVRLMSSRGTEDKVAEGVNTVLEVAEVIQETKEYWKAKQWKIRGAPFSGHKGCGVGADLRLMIHNLTKIMKHFHAAGWRLVASGDVSAKYFHGNDKTPPHPLDTHSWFFLHDPAGVLAAPETADLHHLLGVEELKSEGGGGCSGSW